MTKGNIINNLTENQRRDFYFKNHYPDLYNEIIQSNKLNITYFSQILYNYCYDIKEIPKCKICGNELKFVRFTIGYRTFCSTSCAMHDKDLIKKRNEKTKKTCLDKYGVENVMQTKEFKEKIKETCIQKYGKEFFMQTDEFKEKMIKNNKKKYGVDYYFQTEDFKEKVKNYSLNKYGIEHYNQSEEIINKKHKTNLEKYGNIYPTTSKQVKDKIKEAFLNKYNFEHHMTYKKEMNLLKDFFKNKSDEYYKKYENDIISIIDINDDILHMFDKNCNHDFYINKQLLYLRNKNNHKICTKCNNVFSKNTSYMEKELLEFIKNNVKYGVLYNVKNVIKLELDIYIPELSVAFEFNGLYWHNELYKDKYYHYNKTKLCEDKNIRLYHVYEDDWVYNNEKIKNDILNILNKNYLKLNDENILDRGWNLYNIKNKHYIYTEPNCYFIIDKKRFNSYLFINNNEFNDINFLKQNDIYRIYDSGYIKII
jgi:hypothetical protein